MCKRTSWLKGRVEYGTILNWFILSVPFKEYTSCGSRRPHRRILLDLVVVVLRDGRPRRRPSLVPPAPRPTSSSLLLSSSTITIFHGSKNSQINNITFLLSCHISISRIMHNTVLAIDDDNQQEQKKKGSQKEGRFGWDPVRYVSSIFCAPIFRAFQKRPG